MLRERLAQRSHRRTGTSTALREMQRHCGDPFRDPDGEDSACVRARLSAPMVATSVARQCVPEAKRFLTCSPITRLCVRRVTTPTRRHARRCLLPRRDIAGLLRLGVPWRYSQRGFRNCQKGFSVRTAVTALREPLDCRLGDHPREGAPIPLRRCASGITARCRARGDAAGVVCPASARDLLRDGRWTNGRRRVRSCCDRQAKALLTARKRFMKAHGRVFLVLGIMQRFWYSSDKRRERFVKICADRDVQHLTWQAYMHKKLVRAKPMAHVRIFFKDTAHLLGLLRT